MTFYEKIQNYPFVFRTLNWFVKPVFKILRKIHRNRRIEKGSCVIISLHKIGDTVFTIPAILEIQKSFSQDIHIICYKDSVPIYRLMLKNIVYYPISKSDFFFKRRFANSDIKKLLSNITADTIIDLTGETTSASIIFDAKARMIIGSNKNVYQEIYDVFYPINPREHLVIRYLNFVHSFLGIELTYKYSFKFINFEKIENIFIHPFAGWNSKEWNIKKIIELASILTESFIVTFIIPESRVNDSLMEIINEYEFVVIITDTIEDLIRSLKKCHLFIGSDSGPLYLANILGIATFSLYGPTNPRFSLPFGSYHNFINKSIKCSPNYNSQMCFTNGGRDGCPSYECMHSLSVEEVKEKLYSFIEDVNNKFLIEDHN